MHLSSYLEEHVAIYYCKPGGKGNFHMFITLTLMNDEWIATNTVLEFLLLYS